MVNDVRFIAICNQIESLLFWLVSKIISTHYLTNHSFLVVARNSKSKPPIPPGGSDSNKGININSIHSGGYKMKMFY